MGFLLSSRSNRTEQRCISGCRFELLASASPLAAIALLVGLAAPAIAQVNSQEAAPDASAPDAGGDEIVVTAQRRSQRIIDVPYNISAISGADLNASGTTNANDLTKVVAGLGNFAEGPASRMGENNFSLRGLRTDIAGADVLPKFTVSSVSTYYGDNPVFFPILLKDLERVEVLRGPQGTLYGSGAQAGTIRFIPNRPSFDRLNGEVNASTGITYSASKPNASVDGVINLPLAENLAVRLSGAYVRQAGFIDQVNLFQLDDRGVPVPSVPGDLTSGPIIAPIRKNTNSSEQWMTRAALRYKPTDWLDLELSYLHQYTHADDAQEANPNYRGGVEDITVDPNVPGGPFFPSASYQTRPGGQLRNTSEILQPTTAKLDILSGTASADLGFAELTSVSSYYKTETSSVYSGTVNAITPFFNGASAYLYYPRLVYTADPFLADETGFTEEVRLVSSTDSPLSYVVGAYYQKQKKHLYLASPIPGLDEFAASVGAPSANPQLVDVAFTADFDFRTTDLAAFGELTYRITDAWQVTGGIRIFKQKQTSDRLATFPFFGAAYADGTAEPVSLGASRAGSSASVSDKVFKVNTSYNLGPDTKLYATYAEGFRRGGANTIATTGPFASLPDYLSFKPDFAYNYEIGLKGLALDRRLSYSIAAYWIDLKNFQFNGTTPSFYSAVFNGEKSRSRGLEIEGSFKASDRLTLSGSYTFTDAKVIKGAVIRDYQIFALFTDPDNPEIIDNPYASIASGAKLPGVSRHSAIAAFDYVAPLGGDSKLILHGNANYRSKQNTSIAVTSPLFTVLKDVFMADARITYDSGRNWSAGLFVTNLTNAIGYSGGLGFQNIPNIYARKIVATPRTFGLSVNYGF